MFLRIKCHHYLASSWNMWHSYHPEEIMCMEYDYFIINIYSYTNIFIIFFCLTRNCSRIMIDNIREHLKKKKISSREKWFTVLEIVGMGWQTWSIRYLEESPREVWGWDLRVAKKRHVLVGLSLCYGTNRLILSPAPNCGSPYEEKWQFISEYLLI